MLFMVIEHFKDVDLLEERFKRQGRMLPEGVTYQASWVDADRKRCFQIMEAANLQLLMSWVHHWDDIVDFEIVPVVTSQEYWAARAQSK